MTDWATWKKDLPVKFIDGLASEDFLNHACTYADEEVQRRQRIVVNHQDKDKKDIFKAGKKPQSSEEIATQIAVLWDEFTRNYTKNGGDAKKLEAVNALSDIAFGEGIDAFLAKQGLPHGEAGKHFIDAYEKARDEALAAPEKSADYERLHPQFKKITSLRDAITALSEAQSKTTNEKQTKTKPLNKMLTAALTRQWIALERGVGLYPPLAISSHDGVSADEKERIFERRRTLLRTPAAIIIVNGLWAVNAAPIAAQTATALEKTSSREPIGAALSLSHKLFEHLIFKYDTTYDNSFLTYVTNGIKRFLRQSLDKDARDPVTRGRTRVKGNHDGIPFLNNLRDYRTPDPTVATEQNELYQFLSREVEQHLDGREREIIELRAGGMTLKEVGHEMGVTKERVRQIEGRARNKIWDALKRKRRPDKDTEFTEPVSHTARLHNEKNGENVDLICHKDRLRDVFTNVSGGKLSFLSISESTGIDTRIIIDLLSRIPTLVDYKALSDEIREPLVEYVARKGGDVEAFNAAFNGLREKSGPQDKGSPTLNFR